jgi:hypothetical protein
VTVASNQEVRRGFAGGIRTVRRNRAPFREQPGRAQAAIRLICGYLDETPDFILPAGIEQVQGAYHISPDEFIGVQDAAVHVRFGCKINDGVNPFPEYLADRIRVAYVPLDELVPGVILETGKVFEIAGVGELIQVQHAAVRIFLEDEPNKIRSYEAGPACNQ